MQPHVLIHKKPTYFNVADVEKNPNATSKQPLKNNANTKQNPIHKPSCGN